MPYGTTANRSGRLQTFVAWSRPRRGRPPHAPNPRCHALAPWAAAPIPAAACQRYYLPRLRASPPRAATTAPISTPCFCGSPPLLASAYMHFRDSTDSHCSPRLHGPPPSLPGEREEERKERPGVCVDKRGRGETGTNYTP